MPANGLMPRISPTKATAADHQIKQMLIEPLPAGPFSKQDLFDDTLGQAIREASAFLATPIPPTHPDFSRLWGIKASLIATVMGTAVKIDENNLKRARNDGFAELMQQVDKVQGEREARRRLAVAPDLTPK